MMPVGDKIKFDSEVQRYTVQAFDDRFAIMTKPFNARRTYLYTITDLERGKRGACNLIFGPPCDVNTPDGANELLAEMQSGEIEVSYRNCVPLSKAEVSQIVATTKEADPNA